MVFKRRGCLIPGASFPVQDVGNGQRKNALGCFLEGTVENLVHFVLRHETGSGNAQEPEQGDAECKADAQAFL
jgi:hypothetical protein